MHTYAQSQISTCTAVLAIAFCNARVLGHVTGHSARAYTLLKDHVHISSCEVNPVGSVQHSQAYIINLFDIALKW